MSFRPPNERYFENVALVTPDTVGEPAADLADLLDELVAFIRRYIVLSDAQTDAVTLWIAHTHVVDAFDTTPYLAITSPEKRCGKSRVFEVLEMLVARPWKVVTPTEAVVFRKIDRDRPTLLLDEVDAIFGPKANGTMEPLRAILNAGNRRGTTVPRCVGQSNQLEEFDVFCPKALAGIGDPPDTVADRAVRIAMKRKAPDEKVERLRLQVAQETAEPLRQMLAAWSQEADVALERASPAVPEALDDRAQDSWEPLLAVAEVAGAAWLARARTAAIRLSSGEAREEESIGVRLLADVKAVFEERGADRVPSADLAIALAELEDAPWGEWRGKPLTQNGLARLLRPYGVKPKAIRVADTTPRGYEREQFDDAWNRYLPENDAQDATAATSARPCGIAAISEVQQDRSLLHFENGQNACKSGDVAAAALETAGDEGSQLAEVDVDAEAERIRSKFPDAFNGGAA